MLIEHISVSRKQCFDTCDQQYKYKYHLKMVSDFPEAPWFAYGKIVHKIAEHYVDAKGQIDINQITHDVLYGKILLEENKPAPSISADYRKKLPVHVANVKKISDRIGFDGHLEWPFFYDLEPPSGRHIKGFIDRLIIRGDKYFILDYKTTKKGKWRKNANTIGDDLQLRAYARVVQREFNVPAENIKAALYYLDGGDLVSTGFTEESIATAEQELLETFKRIENLNPDHVRGNPGDYCQRCDYRNKCPFYDIASE